ncbi:hypothetical protein [Gimesia sp.]
MAAISPEWINLVWLTYEFVRQAGLTYQKQGKRCFLLVTPSLPQVGDKK